MYYVCWLLPVTWRYEISFWWVSRSIAYMILTCFASIVGIWKAGNYCSIHTFFRLLHLWFSFKFGYSDWRFVQLHNKEIQVLRFFHSHWASVEETPCIQKYSFCCYLWNPNSGCRNGGSSVLWGVLPCVVQGQWKDMLEDICAFSKYCQYMAFSPQS